MSNKMFLGTVSHSDRAVRTKVIHRMRKFIRHAMFQIVSVINAKPTL
jgi:hypothetical protein